MINLKVRTEYSFRFAYGKIKDIVNSQSEVIAVADRFTTFGHVPMWELCKKQKKKAILGVELAFVENASMRVKQTAYFVTLLAVNQKGLARIYELVSNSTLNKYYYNRLAFEDLLHMNENDIVIIFENSCLAQYLKCRKNTYYGISPMSNYGDYNIIAKEFPIVAISDNLYDTSEHKALYEIILGNGMYQDRSEPSHILNETEWKNAIHFLSEEDKNIAVQNTYNINQTIQPMEFAQAKLPSCEREKTLRELCVEGAKKRNIDLDDPIYKERLDRELNLIAEKKYEDYFYLVWDLVAYAKKHMLVGAARGSSAGSLVCYLLAITEIDPLPFDLIFERFIDINRFDVPDIDIDLQDTKRDMCIEYLKEKYGRDCVAKLGTVAKYKPKSILTELAKVLAIPAWEIKDLKEAVPERSGGDSRAANCLEDTFTELDIGKAFVEKYPEIIYSQEIEAHNRHYGQHAAGIVVSDKPITNYCAMDLKEDHCMLDKHDAESVNLLKMDCLGLRTLSVIQDCLDLIGKDREWLLNYPFEDKEAFAIINNRKYSGIFQYEGYALQSVSKQMEIKNFNDVCLITALARPGCLISGGTTKYINSRNANTPNYLPCCEKYTEDTLGVIVYQEQVMNIVRNVGNLSWEDTSTLRKALSKSYGIEYFDKFWERFKVGSLEKHNMDEKTSRKVWDNVNTMGCLSGETLINLPSNKLYNHFITLKKLYENTTDQNSSNHGHISSYWERFMDFENSRVHKQHLYCMDENQKIEEVELLDVIESGIKTTYELKLESAYKIRATMNHKFFTGKEWKPLSELKVGDKIAIRGLGKNHQSIELVRIVQMGDPKEEMTYDIAMPEPNHNFVANNIIVHNSWSFNKSHSVAYGLISYHCMVLKAHYPLEFALATLKNSKSEDQTVQILKELDNEGYKYSPFDEKLSDVDWSIKDGKLIGGFINIKGVGLKKAQKLIEKREQNKELTVGERKLLYNAETPYDDVFEFKTKFKNFYNNWNLFFKDKPVYIKDIDEVGGEVRYLCKMIGINLRDVNEAVNLKRRNGKLIEKGCMKFLDLKMADDTDTILGRINRENFEKFGRDILEKNKDDSYYLIHGKCCTGFRYIIIDMVKRITLEEVNKKVLEKIEC